MLMMITRRFMAIQDSASSTCRGAELTPGPNLDSLVPLAEAQPDLNQGGVDVRGIYFSRCARAGACPSARYRNGRSSFAVRPRARRRLRAGAVRDRVPWRRHAPRRMGV